MLATRCARVWLRYRPEDCDLFSVYCDEQLQKYQSAPCDHSNNNFLNNDGVDNNEQFPKELLDVSDFALAVPFTPETTVSMFLTGLNYRLNKLCRHKNSKIKIGNGYSEKSSTHNDNHNNMSDKTPATLPSLTSSAENYDYPFHLEISRLRIVKNSKNSFSSSTNLLPFQHQDGAQQQQQIRNNQFILGRNSPFSGMMQNVVSNTQTTAMFSLNSDDSSDEEQENGNNNQFNRNATTAQEFHVKRSLVEKIYQKELEEKALQQQQEKAKSEQGLSRLSQGKSVKRSQRNGDDDEDQRVPSDDENETDTDEEDDDFSSYSKDDEGENNDDEGWGRNRRRGGGGPDHDEFVEDDDEDDGNEDFPLKNNNAGGDNDEDEDEDVGDEFDLEAEEQQLFDDDTKNQDAAAAINNETELLKNNNHNGKKSSGTKTIDNRNNHDIVGEDDDDYDGDDEVDFLDDDDYDEDELRLSSSLPASARARIIAQEKQLKLQKEQDEKRKREEQKAERKRLRDLNAPPPPVSITEIECERLGDSVFASNLLNCIDWVIEVDFAFVKGSFAKSDIYEECLQVGTSSPSPGSPNSIVVIDDTKRCIGSYEEFCEQTGTGALPGGRQRRLQLCPHDSVANMIATIERNEKRPVGRILDFSGEYGICPLERLADVFLLNNEGGNVDQRNRLLRFLVEFGNDDRDDVYSPVALAATWAV